MTATNGHPPDGAESPAQAPAGLRGRFLLAAPETGSGAILAWATDLCENCLGCGCGTQREPFDLTPAGAMKTFGRLKDLQKNGIPS